MKKIKMVAHGTNIPLPVGNGKLTLCALDDFRDTLRGYHTVVTLCKYKPTYPIGCENENHHREKMYCYIVFMGETEQVV